MKIIINIPKDKYLFAKKLAESEKEDNPVVLAIGNGIPLPKEYEKLICLNPIPKKDRDNIKKYISNPKSRFYQE